MYKSVYLTICAALLAVSLTSVDAGPHQTVAARPEPKLVARYWQYPGYSHGGYNRGRYRNHPYRKPRRPRKPRGSRKPKHAVAERPAQPAPVKDTVEAPKGNAPKENAPAENTPAKPAKIIMLTKSKDPEQEDHEDEERDEKGP